MPDIEDHHERLVRLEEQMKHITVTVDKMAPKVDRIDAQANRWKGATVVLLGLGGIAGAILNKFWPG